jgi:hypothetical protein
VVVSQDKVAGMLMRRFWVSAASCCVPLVAIIAAAVQVRATPIRRWHKQPSGVRVDVAAAATREANSWVTLRITFPDLTLRHADVQIQDARGGLIIGRQFSLLRRHVLMPLPSIAGASGNSVRWPVIITLRVAGKVVRSFHYSIRLPPVAATPPPALALPRQLQGQLRPVAAAMGKKFVPLVVSSRQLARWPVLNFASCRWLLLDRTAAAALSQRRALALLSLGVRFICIGNKPPRLLPATAWTHAGNTSTGALVWITPAFDGFGHGPPVVQPRLARLRVAALTVPISWPIAAWVIGPLTIIMIILLRWVIPRRAGFMLVVAAGVTLLSVAAIAWLDDTTGLEQTSYQWMTYYPPGPLALRTTITVCRALQDGSYGRSHHALEPAAITLPLAWSPRAWFAFHGQLTLGRNSSHLIYPLSRRITILTYETQAMVGPDLPDRLTMSAAIQAVQSRAGISSRHAGVIFFKGQVFTRIGARHGHDFYSWLHAQNPAAQAALHFWLRMAINPRRRYYLIPSGHLIIISLPES